MTKKRALRKLCKLAQKYKLTTYYGAIVMAIAALEKEN